jgi:DNA-directed RNA polymerase beta subunit
MADTLVEDKTTIAQDRKEAIAAAVGAVEKDLGKVEDTKVETKVEDKKEETKKEDKPVEKTKDELEAEQVYTQKAIQLMKALDNPETAPTVVDYLARQLGYIKPPETKTEVKEVKNAIHEALRESLSDKDTALDMSFLADKLAPAIEKILKTQLAESQKDIRESFERQEADKLKSQSASAIEKVSTDFFGAGESLPPAVEKEMSSFMDKVAPSADMTVKEYIELAFHSAVGKLGLTKVDPKQKQRTSTNRTDAASRLASERSPAEENLKTDTSKPMSRKDAIKAAIEAVEKQ